LEKKFLETALGNYPQAIIFLQEQLDIAREIGDRQSEANALNNLGLTISAASSQPWPKRC
jgi:tetratricopeptide (TPR) repeat protein